MARPKGYIREEVLDEAIALFWAKGFADTSLQDLERVTGLNKSSLYAEFEGKEDIFLQSLAHYLCTRSGVEVLKAEPKGWANVKRFLYLSLDQYSGMRGCFSINSMREAATLPKAALVLIENHNETICRALIQNLVNTMPRKKASLIAEVIMTYFSGLCIEENLHPPNTQVLAKISNFLRAVRGFAENG